MIPETAGKAETSDLAVCLGSRDRDPHAIRNMTLIEHEVLHELSASVEC